MLFLLLLLPLLGAISAGLFGHLIGRKGAALLTTALIWINIFICILLSKKIYIDQKICIFDLGTWINSGLLNIDWNFMYDALTLSMLFVVNIISGLVHLYSTEYMKEDPHLPRFMSYLSLFTFFMLILITGNNFILMFLGWEGVGLCSYLLISFWYTRIQANKSAIKALVVNRVSDFAFTIGIICAFFTFQSVDFSIIFPLIPFFCQTQLILFNVTINVLDFFALLLFIGAMGKSAQLFLHTWLPDAMEGPTPVSALIHAATMVTAGVFLVIRCSSLFEYTPSVLIFITVIGAFTAFFAATAGLMQSDIKKVIAYSTCSQLGYMFFVCGLSGYHIGLFHLVNHAFFKALLFLSAGAIIHSAANEQDMRKFGGLIKLLPFTYIMLLIGSLSLMGFPFLTGYYSKDLILEFAFAKYCITGNIAYLLGLITAFVTSFYSFRVLYLTFFIKTNMNKKIIKNMHELPFSMAFAMVILCFGSIFIGYLTKDIFVGIGSNFWNTSIYIHTINNTFIETEFTPLFVKLAPFFLSMFAVVFVFIFYSICIYNSVLNFVWFSLFQKKIHYFLSYKWYFDVIYNKHINLKILNKSYTHIFLVLDKGIIEHIGPLGGIKTAINIGDFLNKLQSGLIYEYALFIFITLTTFIISIDCNY